MNDLLSKLDQLPALGNTIGRLEAAQRRCKRTDSPKWQEYERRRIELQNLQLDIISQIKAALRGLRFQFDIPGND